MKVIGMRKFEYTSKKSGIKYQSANIYCTYESSDTLGLCCESVFLSADKVPGELQIGSEIRVIYNRFGSVDAIEMVK